MMSIVFERIAAVGILVLINLCLIPFIKLDRKQIKSALTASFIIAFADFIFEMLMQYFDVWHYHFPFSLWGMPLDLFPDFFLISLILCQGYIFFQKQRKPARWSVMYIIITSLLLGTHAYFKNLRVASEGFITFTDAINMNTPWFISGNYFAGFGIVLLIVLLYSFLLRKTYNR